MMSSMDEGGKLKQSTSHDLLPHCFRGINIFSFWNHYHHLLRVGNNAPSFSYRLLILYSNVFFCWRKWLILGLFKQHPVRKADESYNLQKPSFRELDSQTVINSPWRKLSIKLFEDLCCLFLLSVLPNIDLLLSTFMLSLDSHFLETYFSVSSHI